MDTDTSTTTELNEILNRTAARIVDGGTVTESRTLHFMASAACGLAPGAAAALVDWDGSEIARLRAFGIVHGVVLRDLDPRDRSQLLAQVRGDVSAAPAASPVG